MQNKGIGGLSRRLGFDTIKLLTPQEHIMIGGSPATNALDSTGTSMKRKLSSRTPQAIVEGLMSIEDANNIRQELGTFQMSPLLGMLIGDPKARFGLAKLKPKTGTTEADPVVVKWDEEKEAYVEDTEKTQELYRKFKESGTELHLDKKTIEAEGGGQAGETKA